MQAYILEKLFSTGWQRGGETYWTLDAAVDAGNRLIRRKLARGIRVLPVNVELEAVAVLGTNGAGEEAASVNTRSQSAGSAPSPRHVAAAEALDDLIRQGVEVRFYDRRMDAIQQLSEAARRLTPDQLRERLAEIDQESRIVRALLRATLRDEPRAAKQEADPLNPSPQATPEPPARGPDI